MVQQVPLFIDGEFITSQSDQKLAVTNPATQKVLAEVPLATPAEMEQAIAGAKQAFETWRAVPVTERARVMIH